MIGVIAVLIGIALAYIGHHEAKRNADLGRPITALFDVLLFLAGVVIVMHGFAVLVAEGSL